MDVNWFLKKRTKFIRQYYVVAIAPFETIKSQIENGEEPYEPPYSEDGEPPFQVEWSDADTSVQVVGRMCVVMLSESVKLYFQTWEELLGVKCQLALTQLFKKKGFLAGYKECFRQVADLDWDECPADLSIIEEIVFARNVAAHHNGHLGSMSARYSKEVRVKLESPLFLHDYEKRALNEDQKSVFTFLRSELVITGETLDEAVRHVELLVDWMEPQLQEVRWRPRTRDQADGV
ncbi:hypothetical protein [Bradyrhizobium sp. URHC0002]